MSRKGCMVFNILRAGKKIRAVSKSLESELELLKYHAARENRPEKHPLAEDIDILHKQVEWLRFSKPAHLFLQDLKAEEQASAESAHSDESPAQLPFATLSDILLDPGRFAGEPVIIEGELEFYSRNKSGESWHIFSDRGGIVTAVSDRELPAGHGTLFGIARRTDKGRQVFLEIKNFRPRA